MQVLLVEDDDRVGNALSDVLRQHGFQVTRASTGAEALQLLDDRIDVVVLDLGLPDRDGFEICARLRRQRGVPIIIATARGDLASRVHGLHIGADDYLVKPFDIRELMARITAVTRRVAERPSDLPRPAPRRLLVAGAVVDLDARTIEVDGTARALTRKEFDLLALLASRPGMVFRREQIVSEVWQCRWPDGQRTLEVHVASLRAKTGLPGLVRTVRGVGYRLAPEQVETEVVGGAPGPASGVG